MTEFEESLLIEIASISRALQDISDRLDGVATNLESTDYDLEQIVGHV